MINLLYFSIMHSVIPIYCTCVGWT